MFDSLKQNPNILSAQKQYEMLPSRDQLALKLLLGVVCILVLYGLFWLPAQSFMTTAKAELGQRQALLQLVQTNKSTLKSLSSTSQSSSTKLDSQQLVSSVTNLAKKHNLALKRFEPSGDNKVKVWVDEASFDKLMAWLSELKKSLNVQVEQVSIEKEDSEGLVSARLTLAS